MKKTSMHRVLVVDDETSTNGNFGGRQGRSVPATRDDWSSRRAPKRRTLADGTRRVPATRDDWSSPRRLNGEFGGRHTECACYTGPVDAAGRVVQGTLTGVGFIGGGVILKMSEEHQILGITTAAGIVADGRHRHRHGNGRTWAWLSSVRFWPILP